MTETPTNTQIQLTREWLGDAGPALDEKCTAQAQVHATLAVATALQTIADRLEGIESSLDAAQGISR